jgi:glycosyltransferase involved in cell wall biosynthesis
MDNKAPFICVIVAVYNGRSTLQQCIDSFAKQSYPHKELIVIDGASRDGTAALLESNREKLSYWVSEPDRGIYNAWNKALPHARGEWICFLGADDFFWDSEVLTRIGAHLETLPPAIRVAYGSIMLLDKNGMELNVLGEPWHRIKDRFKRAMGIPHPGVMHRRDLFEAHGRFDESFRIAADYEFLLRELPKADAFFIPDVIAVGMRQGGISSTPANELLLQREIRRAQRMHGYPPPWHVTVLTTAKILARLLLIRIMGETRLRKMILRIKRLK